MSSDVGFIFPPRDHWDIAAYDTDEVVAGYREHCSLDDAPGGNRSAGYRWGWMNARKDATGVPDGYEHIRYNFISMTRRAN